MFEKRKVWLRKFFVELIMNNVRFFDWKEKLKIVFFIIFRKKRKFFRCRVCFVWVREMCSRVCFFKFLVVCCGWLRRDFGLFVCILLGW